MRAVRAILKLGLLVGALTIVSCAPRPVVVNEVAPTARKAQSDVKRSNESSAKLEQKVNDIQTVNKDMGVQIDLAVAEADRLRKKGEATASELEAQYLQMANIQGRNMFLEEEIEKAVANTVEQRILREAAEARLSELVPMTEDQDKNVVTLEKAVESAEGDAAIGKMVKIGLWVFAGALAIGVVAVIVIKLTKTAAKVTNPIP